MNGRILEKIDFQNDLGVIIIIYYCHINADKYNLVACLTKIINNVTNE